MIATLLTTDGRLDLIEQTIPSLLENVGGLDGPKVIWDDSGDPGYFAELRQRFEPTFEIRASPTRVGQARAVRLAWGMLREPHFVPCDYVFHVEDDFLFKRSLDVRDLRALMEDRPYLAQVALLRQPWFKRERAAGGILEADPEEYTTFSEASPKRSWIEHRRWFTLNPCLYRRALCFRHRPDGPRHEWEFSRQLCEDPEVRFAFWGDGEVWVHHIGDRREGFHG